MLRDGKTRWEPCGSQLAANELFLQALRLGQTETRRWRYKLNGGIEGNSAQVNLQKIKGILRENLPRLPIKTAYIQGKDRQGNEKLTRFHYCSIKNIIQAILINPSKAGLLSLDLQFKRFKDFVKHSSVITRVKNKLLEISEEGWREQLDIIMKKEFEIYSRNRNFCRFQKALCLFFRKEGLEVHSVLSEIKPEAASEVTVPVKVFFLWNISRIILRAVPKLRNQKILRRLSQPQPPKKESKPST